MSDRRRLKWLKTEKLFLKMVLNLKAVNFLVWHVITKFLCSLFWNIFICGLDLWECKIEGITIAFLGSEWVS